MVKGKKQIKTANAPTTAIVKVRSLLGPAPVLSVENAAEYQSLFNRIADAVQPQDALEEFWVRDIADLIWETLRLRRMKVELLRTASKEGLERVLEALGRSPRFGSGLIDSWMRRDPDQVAEVAAWLEEAGLTEDAILAQALVENLDAFDKIDRMITQTESRRNAMLREIDRHREAVAQRLRQASHAIEDAQFMEVSQDREPEP